MIWDRAEDRYKLIFNVIPNPAILLDLDNRVEAINDACIEYFQAQVPASIIFGEKLPVDKLFPWIINELSYFLSVNSPEFTFEREIECPKGRINFQIRFKKILDPYDIHQNTLILLNDITSVVEAEKKVARARDFYLTLFEEFPAMIWRASADGQFDYFNRAWLVFTGQSLEEQKGFGWARGVPEADRERFVNVYAEAMREKKAFEIELRLRRYDGHFRWVLNVSQPFYSLEGDFAGFIGTCYDITERKMQEEELSYLAMHDPLTGLPNRRMMEVILPRLVEQTELGINSALFFTDLDNFKQVNDRFGHMVGDELLIELGKILKRQLRDGDLLVRLGGDEFAILLDGIEKSEAEQIARRLLDSVANHQFITQIESIKLYLSIGVVLISNKKSPGSFIALADSAMYQAKESGGNQYILAS
ncbi:MAG TPA: sensor domain-containing diguanylate cyclase [Candidatus Saccharicenans sp.]|jgi:diguanylate cyclase (GGDEF)-like protein/PAS domain S-box-containing protein|nr:GGDEF domain-containing protein [Candidatus Saccharicenans sp.]HRD02641.1 sensor domain-containing diguanylate cyclase [Candidatus Saccharicenans sp.]